MIKSKYILLSLFLLYLGCREDDVLNLSPNAPVIDQIVPQEGQAGELIRVQGSNLDDVDTVWVNGTRAPITAQAPAELTFRIVEQMTTGPVVVRNPFGTTLGPDLFILAPMNIVIDSVSPASGFEGTPVSVFGKRFSQLQPDFEVRFNETTAAATIEADTLIITSVPARATSGLVTLINGQDTINGPQFTVEQRPPLTITSINPASGEALTEVTVTGTNFGTQADDIEVTLNGIQAQVSSVSETEIVFTVPQGAASGPVVVRKLSTNQQATGPEFTVLAPVTVQSISPTSGEAGTQVTITGTNFGTNANNIEVTVNGTQAQVNSVTGTQIVFIVPAGATTGPVVVRKTSTGQEATGPEFTVLAPVTIQSISPTSGPELTEVTITGSNFGTNANDIEVTVNGTAGTVSSVSNTQIIFTVANGSTTGPVVVRKLSTNQQATGPEFTVLAPVTIQSISPTSGEAGTQVTITGTNFGTNANNIEVTVNGTQAQVNSVTGTQIVFIVPAGATTGPVVVRKTSTGQEATGPEFTVLAPVTIQSISPTSGPELTEVTITGSNFGTNANDIEVTVNGTAGTVSLVSNTQIIFTVANGSTSGSVVVRKLSTNQQATGPEFTVLAPVTIQSISPTSGPVLTEVTITGSNFGTNANDIEVTINGIQAQVNSVANGQLVFIVPAGATTGPVEIRKLSTNQQATGPVFTVIVAPVVTVSTVVNNGIGNPFDVLQLGSVTVNSHDAGHQLHVYDLNNNTVTSIGTGQPGLTNGTLATSQFNQPTGLALDASNVLYVADRANHVIRAVSGGNTFTIAGIGQAGFADGQLQQQAQFNEPIGVVVIGSFIYVADFQNHAIRRIDVQNDQVTTIAGNGQPGFVNGSPQISQLNLPVGLAEDADGNLLIADLANHSIRKLNLSTLELTTVAGTGASGNVDGANNIARFNSPSDISVDSQGAIYVADLANQVIRKIEAGSTSTFAGTGTAGYTDGAADQAQFNQPIAVFVVSDTEILVADYNNGAIRRIIIQ